MSVNLATIRMGVVVLAAAAMFCALPAAAAITWSAPTDSTGKSTDVITRGTLLVAETFSRTVTVNGVTFNHTDYGEPNTDEYGVLTGYGTFTSDWDPEYRTLVETTAYLTSGWRNEFTFGVLPAGSYLVQLFMPQWDANWATGFWLNGAISSPVQVSGGLPGGPNYPPRAKTQWISVEFEADGVSPYTLRSLPLTTYQLLAAYQFRSLTESPTATVPEPSTWAIMILGFGLAGAAQRRQRRRVLCA